MGLKAGSDQSTPVRIMSSHLAATISTTGAELQSLTDSAGREFLWNGDPKWWTGRAPILFPIVGALAGDQHVVDGKTFSLPKHGFARRSLFEVTSQTDSVASFRLGHTEATLAAYPYRFQLDIKYAIDRDTLGMTAAVTNTDSQPIPVAFGFHPAFLWPLPGAGPRNGHMIEFDADEPAPAARIDGNGLVRGLEPASRVTQKRLSLTDDLFDDDALLFLAPASRGLLFGAADGQGTAFDIAFPDMPHLGIWTKPGGAPFLCIEPWHGYASPAGFSGALMEKPGMSILPPAETQDFSMSVTLVNRPD